MTLTIADLNRLAKENGLSVVTKQVRPKMRSTRLTQPMDARLEAYLSANPETTVYELLASSLDDRLKANGF